MQEKTQHGIRYRAFSGTVECDKHRRGIDFEKLQFSGVTARFIVRRREIKTDTIG